MDSDAGPVAFPDLASLAALRAWYEGMGARDAVHRYLADKRATHQSSRALLGRIRKRLAAFALTRHRPDLAAPFLALAGERIDNVKAVAASLAQLPMLPAPQPVMGDGVERWLAPRAAQALRKQGLKSMADIAVRITRRRRWWAAVPGLGQASARRIEEFFAQYPELVERAQTLVVQDTRQYVVPFERVRPPQELDGSAGAFRAPRATSTLHANDDYQAVQAWIELQESSATRRAYRKEAERLMLWAIIERGKPLSSLTTEDAVAYRSFLRHPAPRARWVGPVSPRSSLEWRPFTGDLSARSVAYGISVLGALYRWLIEQRYLLANPFSGVKVRNGRRSGALDAGKSFTEGEWSLLQAIAQALEFRHGWTPEAAQRLRFLLNFCYPTGLRAGEFVQSTLGDIKNDADGRWWLEVIGKGAKPARVCLPSMAVGSLESYLSSQGLPILKAKWSPATPLIGRVSGDQGGNISAGRLWSIMKRFFLLAAQLVRHESPAAAQKFASATPHWMRHTHATHALQSGVELVVVRDNLRHASIATTSTYLHAADNRRAAQLEGVFGAK